jgi:hypothetical protein
VANFVAAPYNNGAITYVEYGYALERSFPVASVLNQAGYFVQPTAENVAVALTRARINPDRTQVLDDVYRNPYPAGYPVSSYSYMIVPTSTAAPFTADKGATLGQFILYFLCTGQQKAKPLGYSPLPKNLVQFGFDAESQIPGAPPPPPINSCANPTITGGFGIPNLDVVPPGATKKGQPRAGGTGGGGGGSGGANGGANGGGGGGSQAVAATDTGAAVDPNATGDPNATDSTGATRQAALASAVSVNTSGKSNSVPIAIYIAVGIVALLAIFVPPAIFTLVRRRE